MQKVEENGMNYNRVVGVLGLIVGVAGLLFAIYQRGENIKLKDYNRSQAWYLYAKANTVGHQIQEAYNMYKTKHKDNLNLETVELLSKVDAFSQDLFSETIRQIQLSEPKFDLTTIEQWVQSGKIREIHKRQFTQIMIEDKKEEKQ